MDRKPTIQTAACLWGRRAIALGLATVAILLWSPDRMLAQPPAPFLISPYFGSETVTQTYHTGHQAIDFSLFYERVLAAAAGNVETVDWYNDDCHQDPGNQLCGYGLYVVIRHSNNYRTWYGHLSTAAFGIGDTSSPVSQSQIIGTSGHTGWSEGAHLHFEVRDATNITKVNPGNPNLWLDGQWASPSHPIPEPVTVESSQWIVVDDDPNNQGGFSKGGGGLFNNQCTNNCQSWTRATGVGHLNDMYYTAADRNTSSADQWARWQPSLPSGGGVYEVYVYVPGNHATAGQAPFVVVHANGSRTTTVDQYGLFNQWVSIGTYRMAPGNYVYTHDATGEPHNQHCENDWCRCGNRRTWPSRM